ncbi:hypothetical protein G3496_02710 [Shewanella baltica]|uniref:AAA-like domain-containing protein n=1 Tax=Shewanella baltica TaxID=62322 RepID=UPI00217EE37C|nr:AAA-like domain-containing protein [Shewanella baltica]MCS6133849.1 hypothetical protein [Shewanella baltica]
MTKKVLKKYTTIPQHLYVERAADRQLCDIIEDMQRPGYVLVARQMGKTNLLFNARRMLETDSRKFVYIDLSNNFETERECYNYIIDSIFDVLDDDLWEVRAEIDDIRVKTKTDHLSYTRSLSKILKSLDKDLILILDEIDALRTSDYSDNIFAVIRSNYFTRSNFVEFEHLTYILSGVIEPKDLIKDRNKSPFNIGEKIYLEDFSYLEFSNFIKKSGIGVSEETVEYIYSWTSGNPRLTFDVCSEVETLMISGLPVTNTSIDELINKKYLTSFDIAPIDHIRELVSEDKSIQEAIFNILSNPEGKDSIKVTDLIRNKLYLYGIISSAEHDKSPEIKNKIIKQSLSLDWLRSLSEDPQTIIDKAILFIEKSHDFIKGIELLTDIVKVEELDGSLLSLALYYLGYAESRIGDFESSNKHLLQKPFSKNTSPMLHFRQKLFLGLNFLRLGDNIRGTEELTYVIDNYESNNITWATAALNLAINSADENESANLLEKIVAMGESESEPESDESIRKIKSFSFYQLSILPSSLTSNTPLDNINSALSISTPEIKPSILLQKAKILEDNSSNVYEEIIEFILKNQLSFSVDEQLILSIEYDINLNYHLLSYSYCYLKPLFNRLLKHSIQVLNLSEDEIVKESANLIFEKEFKHEFYKDYIDKDHLNCSIVVLSDFIYFSITNKKLDNDYIQLYLNKLLATALLSSQDIVNLTLIVKTSAEQGKARNGIYYAKKIDHLFINLEDSLRYESSVFYYWKFLCNKQLNILDRDSGDEVLARLDSAHSNKTFIDEEGEKSIRSSIIGLLRESNNKSPIKKKETYKRNDKIKVKYDDGTIVEGKFKKLEIDIKNKKCIILNK